MIYNYPFYCFTRILSTHNVMNQTELSPNDFMRAFFFWWLTIVYKQVSTIWSDCSSCYRELYNTREMEVIKSDYNSNSAPLEIIWDGEARPRIVRVPSSNLLTTSHNNTKWRHSTQYIKCTIRWNKINVRHSNSMVKKKKTYTTISSEHIECSYLSPPPRANKIIQIYQKYTYLCITLHTKYHIFIERYLLICFTKQ